MPITLRIIDGQTHTQKSLASTGGSVTIGGGNGNKVEVIVAESGVSNGVKGLTKSGKDVQIAFPDYLVTAHELFGEMLKPLNRNPLPFVDKVTI